VSSHSNTGAIVGGVIGGIAAISIAAAAIFFYLRRRRSRARSAATPGVGASRPPVDEIKQPLTEVGTITGSTLPGTSPGSPAPPMRFYVRVSIPNPPPRISVCSFFYIRRTQMIQLHSLGLHSHPPPFKDHRMGPETLCPPCKRHRDITVCLPSDFAIMDHRLL
jgi:hypothetical protein